MKKRLLTLCFTMLLVLASSMTALAEDKQGEAGWEVVFDGKQMTSNFSNGKIDDQIADLQPGDSVEITITLRNTYNGQADWYIKNEVGKSLETASSATGAAYDYELTYTNKSGETTVLFSSDYFGGSGRYSGEGLLAAAKALNDFVSLDRLGKDDTGVVKLKVRLEGETGVNAYQNTSARLDMQFATELVDADGGGGGGNRRPVRTGDQSRILLFVVMTLVSGMLLLVIAVMRLRRDQEEAVETVGDTGRKTVRRGRG